MEGRRLPALDGLRGLAIAGVLVVHFGVPGTAGAMHDFLQRLASFGQIGVDLFFVLSGFLITRNLLEAKGRSGYFRKFFSRRAFRIFPLYYLILGLALGLGARASLGSLEPLFWVHLSNWARLAHPTLGWHPALGPMWSLAIEGQFYVVWPFVVLLMGRRGLALLSAILVLVALVLRVFAIQAGLSPVTIWALTPFRIDGLAAGACVAVLFRPSRAFECLGRLARAVVPLMLLVGVVVALLGGEYGLTPVAVTLGYSLVVVVAASLLIATLTGPRLAAWLSVAPLRLLGRLSYALYLLHVPLLTILAPIGTLGLVLWLPICVALAWLSGKYFEQPMIALGRRLARDETTSALQTKPLSMADELALATSTS